MLLNSKGGFINLQPLWSAENIRKGGKFDPETFAGGPSEI